MGDFDRYSDIRGRLKHAYRGLASVIFAFVFIFFSVFIADKGMPENFLSKEQAAVFYGVPILIAISQAYNLHKVLMKIKEYKNLG